MSRTRVGWAWGLTLVGLMGVAGLLGGCAPGRGVAGDGGGAAVRGEPVARAVLGVGITVGDLDRSVAFFRDVLGFSEEAVLALTGPELERETGVFGAHVRVARLRLGAERLELWEYLAPEGRPMPVPSRGNDGWFQHIAIVVSDMDRAYARLREHRVRFASTQPQTLPASLPNAAGISAFYFRDPDGHFLELIQFPPGKGEARWQSREGLFLGIDHTAIVVRDTGAALAWYRDTLGMRVAGGSENFGVEQEHLNNVRGAHLRITTLKAGAGPGVELLEYLAPKGGRGAPEESAANDLWHWHTVIESSAEAAGGEIFAGAGLRVDSPRGGMVGAGTTMGRDPDGHAVLLVGPGYFDRGR